MKHNIMILLKCSRKPSKYKNGPYHGNVSNISQDNSAGTNKADATNISTVNDTTNTNIVY